MRDVPGTVAEYLRRGVKHWYQGVAYGLNDRYTHMNKFGCNFSLSTTEEDIWDGASLAGAETITLATVAVTLGVSSSDVKDTSAGVGARTIQIYGLDGDYALQNETVILTGRTKKETANAYIRIFRAVVRSCGSEADNAGTIYIYDTSSAITDGVPDTATKLFAAISPGTNQTLMAIYTIPDGYTGYLFTSYVNYGSTASKFVKGKLVVRPFGECFQVKHFMGTDNFAEKYWECPLTIDSKADIKMRGSASATSEVFAGFDLILEQE